MLMSLWFSRALLSGLWKGNITHTPGIFVYFMDPMLGFISLQGCESLLQFSPFTNTQTLELIVWK